MSDVWTGTMGNSGAHTVKNPDLYTLNSRGFHCKHEALEELKLKKQDCASRPAPVLKWPLQGSVVAQGTTPVFPDRVGVARLPGGAHIPATRGR